MYMGIVTFIMVIIHLIRVTYMYQTIAIACTPGTSSYTTTSLFFTSPLLLLLLLLLLVVVVVVVAREALSVTLPIF